MIIAFLIHVNTGCHAGCLASRCLLLIPDVMGSLFSKFSPWKSQKNKELSSDALTPPQAQSAACLPQDQTKSLPFQDGQIIPLYWP